MSDASPAPAPGSGGSNAGSNVRPDQDPAFNPAAGYLNAEARRSLAIPTYSASGPSTVDIPRDTCVKRMLLKLNLQTIPTFGSGSPTTSQLGVFEKICSNVEVNVNGNRLIKSIRPSVGRWMNILLNQMPPKRTYEATASGTAPIYTRTGREWLAGTIAYPATTNWMAFQECFEINFENPLGYGGSRHMSELDIRDVASAVVKFYWQNQTNLIAEGNAASVTYSAVGTAVINVQPMIIENRARPRPTPGQVLYDYVETSLAKTFTGSSKSQQIEMQTGNFLMGVLIRCMNGDANYTLKEELLTNLSLIINGANTIQGPMNLQDLTDENQVRFGCYDFSGFSDMNSTIATVDNVHPLRGVGFMNLIRNGSWNTAINTSRQAGVDSVRLQLDTAATSGIDRADYTNPLEVVVHSHEMRPYIYTR